MFKRIAPIFAFALVLSGVLCCASWNVVSRIVGVNRFIRYDAADHYIDTDWLQSDENSDEFYDADIYSYVLNNTEQTWMAWLEYLPNFGKDRIRLQEAAGTAEMFPSNGVYSKPTIAKVTDSQEVWVTYEEQDSIDQLWKIKLRIRYSSDPNDPNSYSDSYQISEGNGNCINHSVTEDPNGFWIVWQEDVQNQYDICMRRINISNEGFDFGPVQLVSSSSTGDWRPDVAVTTSGKVCVVWDSYCDYSAAYAGDEDSFNVMVRWYDADTNVWSDTFIFPHPTDAIDPNHLTRSAFQGYAQVVADFSAGDSAWVVWEEGEPNWGEVFYNYPADASQNSVSWLKDYPGPLHNYRKLRIAKLQISGDQTHFYESTPIPMESFDHSSRRGQDNERHGVFYEKGNLAFQDDGRLWVFYRHFYNSYCQDEDIFQAWYESGWKICGRYLNGSEWSDLYVLQNSSVPNAVGRWNLDETTGSLASDSSGSGYTGTLYGNPQWNPEGGILNGALTLDGSGDHIRIDGYTGISGTSARTVSAWIRTSANTGYGTIVQWGENDYGKLWLLYVENGKAALAVYGGGVRSERTVADGKWHHLVAVLEAGETDSANIKLYVDGQLDAIPTTGHSINTAASISVHIGGWKLLNDSVVWCFNGVIDDIRIFDEALTADQVLCMCNFNSSHMRDGMQRLSLTAGAGDMELAWTVGRTDSETWPNPADLRGVVIAGVSANVAFSDPDLIQGADLSILADPNIMEAAPITQTENGRYSLALGDLHRHTDVSICQAYLDGSIEDAYRYAIEVANLTMMAITDHDMHLDSGDVRSQIWWRNAKEVSRHRMQNAFFPFYGYETQYRNGHINVISLDADRLREVSDPDEGFFDSVCRDGRAFTIPHAIERYLASSDEECGLIPRENPYTYTHNAGDDHYRNLWEIYQGCRDYSTDPNVFSRQEEAVQDALLLGQHFGLIASSDHASTGRSFAGIWTTQVSTEGIFKAMRARRTYAATDHICLDFRIGDHLMGDRFALDTDPNFTISVAGTAPLETVQLVYGRVGGLNVTTYDFTVDSQNPTEFNFQGVPQLNLSAGNEYFFYLRARQDDANGMLPNRAWSSPIWCLYETDDSGLVHKWQLDETLEDSGIALNHGTSFGDPAWVDGVSGKALSLNGNGDYIAIAGSAAISGSNPRTCAAWIKTTSANYPMIMSWGDGSIGEKWMFGLSGRGGLEVGIWGGVIESYLSDLNDDRWHHVAAVLEEGSTRLDDIILYVDGIEQSTFCYNYSGQIPQVNTADTENLMIGARFAPGVGPYYSEWIYFQGELDDVRIYDKGLGSEDIQDLADMDGAHWKLDETTGSSASDSSGSGYTGTLYGNPQWQPTGGRIDGALQFDGDDDYVQIDGYTGVSGSGPRTCAAWIKTTSANYPMIMSWGNASIGEKWMFSLSPAGKLAVGVWGGFIETSGLGLANNSWHHVAAVYSNTDENEDGYVNVKDILLYVDGVRQSTTCASSTQVMTAQTENVVLGARFADGLVDPLYLDGCLDDIRVYDMALDPQHIQALANP